VEALVDAGVPGLVGEVLDEAVGAVVIDRLGRAGIAPTDEHDAFGVWVDGAHLAEQVAALHLGHVLVSEYERDALAGLAPAAQLSEGGLSRLFGHHAVVGFVALAKLPVKYRQTGQVVVDRHDHGQVHCRLPVSAGWQTLQMKRLPPPGKKKPMPATILLLACSKAKRHCGTRRRQR
jgi:hypothetical protein